MSNYGWECPKCGASYSPIVRECPRCRPEDVLVQHEEKPVAVINTSSAREQELPGLETCETSNGKKKGGYHIISSGERWGKKELERLFLRANSLAIIDRKITTMGIAALLEREFQTPKRTMASIYTVLNKRRNELKSRHE